MIDYWGLRACRLSQFASGTTKRDLYMVWFTLSYENSDDWLTALLTRVQSGTVYSVHVTLPILIRPYCDPGTSQPHPGR